MTRPAKLDRTAVDAWLAEHPGWDLVEGRALAKRFAFADFSLALAFAVRIGDLAEKRDHHPDIEIGWGRARVVWSTHDAGGVTKLDLDAAEASDTMGG
ncbi:MAG: 4a-hydroxytetrahydrobiopterin dehydratase [Polyangiaceae bacterium]